MRLIPVVASLMIIEPLASLSVVIVIVAVVIPILILILIVVVGSLLPLLLSHIVWLKLLE